MGSTGVSEDPRHASDDGGDGDGDETGGGVAPRRLLIATAIRALRARRTLSLASLTLTVVAIGSAVVGPSYQDSAARSFVISQLANQPLIATGLTFDYHSPPNAVETVGQAEATAVGTAAKLAGPAYAAGHPLVWDPVSSPRLPHSGLSISPTLVAATGACEHVALRGRCPTRSGEIAVLQADASRLHLHLGSRIRVAPAPKPYVVTGLYQPAPQDENFWFGPGRLQSVPASGPPKNLPARPAPWITTPQTIQSRFDTAWYVTVDQRLALPPDLTPRQSSAAGARAAALALRADRGDLPLGFDLEPGNSLHYTVHRLLARRGVVGSTVAPAVLSLVLVAMILLLRLLSTAMDLRRGELALAALRGYNRRQLWILGMLEPLLILAAATPIGIVAGYLAARLLAVRWLAPGLPVPLPWLSVLAVLVVVVAMVVCTGVVVRQAISEPLAAQIAAVRRPTRATRAVIVVRLFLAAAVVSVLVNAVSRSGARAPDATDMILPILLAVGAGLLGGIAVTAFAGLWVRCSSHGTALASYVASRAVRRRRAGILMILPVTVAVAIASFTLGVSHAASTWRASAAATQIGAPLSYSTRLSLPRAVGLTHKLDPDGRWLLAAAVDAPNTPGGDVAASIPRLVIDAPRLARVAAWPSQWTPGRSAADVAGQLAPNRRPVVLRGREVSIALDNRVHGDYPLLGVSIDVLGNDGSEREIILGPFRPGRSTASKRIPNCVAGCVLQRITFGGPAALVEAMHGTVTIDSVSIDDQTSNDLFDTGWRTDDPLPGVRSAVRGRPRVRDGRLHVTFGADGPDSYAGITPTDIPKVIPVLWGRLAPQPTGLANGTSGTFGVRSVGTAESMPLRGPSGVLIDYAMYIRHASPQIGATDVHIWARADTPASVRDALAAHGIANPETLVGAEHALNADAFALALRLYGVVTVLIILLALAGLGTNLAIQLPGRRRDAAALRVVGVKKRSVALGVVAEFLVVLGVAALAGVCAGSLAQEVVVRAVTLGFVDSVLTPRVEPSLDLSGIITMAAVMLVLLLVGASAVAILSVRGARTATLREEAQ